MLERRLKKCPSQIVTSNLGENKEWGWGGLDWWHQVDNDHISFVSGEELGDCKAGSRVSSRDYGDCVGEEGDLREGDVEDLSCLWLRIADRGRITYRSTYF